MTFENKSRPFSWGQERTFSEILKFERWNWSFKDRSLTNATALILTSLCLTVPIYKRKGPQWRGLEHEIMCTNWGMINVPERIGLGCLPGPSSRTGPVLFPTKCSDLWETRSLFTQPCVPTAPCGLECSDICCPVVLNRVGFTGALLNEEVSFL